MEITASNLFRREIAGEPDLAVGSRILNQPGLFGDDRSEQTSGGEEVSLSAQGKGEIVPDSKLPLQDNSTDPIMNRDSALARLCGDVSLLRDLAELFLADAPALLSETESALSRHDYATLERAAHSLKGLAANFDGALVMAAARELEELARHQHLADAKPVRDRLAYELDRLSSALVELVKSEGEPK